MFLPSGQTEAEEEESLALLASEASPGRPHGARRATVGFCGLSGLCGVALLAAAIRTVRPQSNSQFGRSHAEHGIQQLYQSSEESAQWRPMLGEGAARELIQEVGTSQWMVVYNGPVNVRASASLSSEVLGRELKCSVVMAQQVGEWIQLADGKGYMMVTNGEESLVVKVTYSRILSGSCSAVGLRDIDSFWMCQIAADWLGVDVFSVSQPSHHGTGGCQLYQGMLLWLNVRPESMGEFEGKETVCASISDCEPVEVPTTTTTTTEAAPDRGLNPLLSSVLTTPGAPVVTSTSRKLYPSLYCFFVMMASGYEPELVKSHFHRNFSIFSCDKHKVYAQGSDVPDLVKGLEVAPLGDVRASAVGDWGSWSNTMVFIRAWSMVAKDADYLEHDWVVKVDPDTVFHPHRLKLHLISFPPDAKIWLQNCIGYPTIGAIEVFSREAVLTYSERSEECADMVEGSAEDYFICKCMERLGVQKRTDLQLLRHEKTGGCENTWTVAFHPYKDVDSFLQCMGER